MGRAAAGAGTGQGTQNLHTHHSHAEISLGRANIPGNILAAPLQGQFQGLIWSEPEVFQGAHSTSVSQFPPSHPGGFVTWLVGGFQLRFHTSLRLPPVAPEVSPDPASWHCQVWIPAGIGQHQARWESSANGSTRTTGKERARAEGGQRREDHSPLGMLVPKGDGCACQTIPQSLQPPARVGEERRCPLCNIPEQLSREKPPSSHTNRTPQPSPGAGVRVPAKPADHLQQVGTQSRERDGPAQGWDEHPEALQHLGRAMERDLGKAGAAHLHHRRFYGG